MAMRFRTERELEEHRRSFYTPPVQVEPQDEKAREDDSPEGR